MSAAEVKVPGEVEDVVRDLKKISGFDSYLILNHDGK